MAVIGRVESLWRYPVKSMRGEQLLSAFIGFAGVYGDRLYAFRSSGLPKGFPFFTAREREQMLRYKPVWRNPEAMAAPPNLREAEALAPGVTPIYPADEDTALDVETPSGELLSIHDPRLIDRLREGLNERHELSLIRSDRSLTDCRPVSLFSLQTVQHLGEEIGTPIDKRSFRANLYVDLASEEGFGENSFLGRTLRIGNQVIISITDLDPRCKMITLDPDTGTANPDVMKVVARAHGGTAGLYGAVISEGTIRPGDEISLSV